MRRVVVTGIGHVSSLGCGAETVWKRVLNGESGIRKITSFDTSDLKTKIGGQVPEGPTSEGLFHADDWVSARDRRRMD